MVQTLPVRYWRPWPLRTPLLVFGIVLCITTGALLQVILLGCGTDGCRVFGAQSTQSSSVLDQTIYRVLPAFLAVCFTFHWAILRHDVLRLEPYFQMSVAGGAPAMDSLLLEYNFMMPYMAVFQATRRRWVESSVNSD